MEAINVGGNSASAIAARVLTKQFGDETAVCDLSFDIPQGSIFGFIGPSGCGKTTTVRLLTGVYQPTSGQAIVLGSDPQKYDSRTRARIGYMPQLFVLYPDLSVWENINFAASLYGMRLAGRRKRIQQLLEFVELDGHQRKLARNISGGMQRRLALASALIHNPELIFMDEPTAGIDPVLRTKFWDQFRQLKEQGRTLFVTTQYVGEAAYCDYVGVMAEGRLLMVETPAGLRKRAFGGDVIDIQADRFIDYRTIQEISALPYVKGQPTNAGENTIRIIVDEASTALPQIVEWFGSKNLDIESAREFIPPFDDVFVSLIQRERNNG